MALTIVLAIFGLVIAAVFKQYPASIFPCLVQIPIALAIGLVLTISSTAIVLQTLNEKGLIRSDGGKASFAVLLAQDIVVIPMLALLPLLALPKSPEMVMGEALQRMTGTAAPADPIVGALVGELSSRRLPVNLAYIFDRLDTYCVGPVGVAQNAHVRMVGEHPGVALGDQHRERRGEVAADGAALEAARALPGQGWQKRISNSLRATSGGMTL